MARARLQAVVVPQGIKSMSAALRLPCEGHLVVVDLEYTAWEGSLGRGWSGPGEHREVVQIGAVRLDAAAGLSETGSFERLVLPRRNPVLSAYFTALTGIDNARLRAEGVPADRAFARFADFADGALIASNGPDHDVVAETCGLQDIADPLAGRDWLDLAPLFADIFGRRIVSAALPAATGLGVCGPAHDALADARAIAVALRRLRKDSRL